MTVYIARAGAQYGPYTWEQVGALLQQDELAPTDLCWTEGMVNWVPLYQHPEGASLATAHPTVQAQRFGGFWVRVVASLIDGFVIGVPFQIVQSVIAPMPGLDFQKIGRNPQAFDAQQFWDFMRLMGIFMIVNQVVQWLYFALMESSRHQATLGKMALGLIVSDEQGRRISFARATGRHFGKLLSGIFTLGIGFLMCGWDPRKQCLHDKIARTFIRRRDDW